MRQYNRILLLVCLLLFNTIVCSITPQNAEYKSWIVDMKESPKGPFSNIYWYCNDGQVLPPKAYACRQYGGGKQHGELNKKTLTLQSKGYLIANLLSRIDAPKLLQQANFNDWYNQLLIEKYLVRADNGWIFERAQFYRGAIQEEDERDGAKRLLTALVSNPEWIGLRFAALRVGAQLLPHGGDSASVQKVRQMSMSLADKDVGFHSLRTKIHVAPDASDAERVLDYAAKINDEETKAEYLGLAKEIDRIFQTPPMAQLLEKNARLFTAAPWLQELLRTASKAYHSENSAENHHKSTAQLLADLRDAMPRVLQAKARLRILDLSLAVETINFKAGTQLRAALANASRQTRVYWLQNAALSAYGCGFINKRSLNALNSSLTRLKRDQLPLNVYLDELRYLARAPSWGTQGLRFQFYRSMMKLTEIEPIASLFIQDVLRGSPLFLYSQLSDNLSRDGNLMAGVRHKLFEQRIDVGVHALNPGIARGVLYANPKANRNQAFDPQGIYVLPETISALPSIAGIITAGEGNALSHVQLLARNLGIPNVTVNENLLEQLQAHDGETVILAVSAKGLVELEKDSEHWREFFESEKRQKNGVIRTDLEKLDLTQREFVDLSQLRASDSGRIVGPKAAKLGELQHHYPNKVAKGVAIPFGIFRDAVLDKTYKNSKQTVFDWMEQRYEEILALPAESEQRKQLTEAFRVEAYEIISRADMGDSYRKKLREMMLKTFGGGKAGVFIRSDTNVEDLPGFSGAGLNLTLFNVVGIDNIFEGIKKVWASPYTARAFSWRQGLMESPQHVYPSILIMQTVANEKSGVMVTQDIDSGDLNSLSVAVNEGVGGAVDGQSAESLRIDVRDGMVRLLAAATAPFRKVPSAKGGINKLPVSGSDTILKADEIRQLLQFAKELPSTFPALVDDSGNAVPADVEFGFYKGQLQLFQIRPFLHDKKAQANSILINMDKGFYQNNDRIVEMKQVDQR